MAKLLLVVSLLALSVISVSSFQSYSSSLPIQRRALLLRSTTEDAASSSKSSAVNNTPPPPPPMLNGKKILPMRVLLPGLQGHDALSAVYAVLTSGYTKADDPDNAWSKVKFVGTTRNLDEALRAHLMEEGSDKVAHVRALTTGLNKEQELQKVAVEWKAKALASGAKLADWRTPEILQRQIEASLGDDGSVVSPFREGGEGTTSTSTTNDTKLLKLNAETVDKVLETVRPYLIQDGGNVSVQQVDPDSKQITLKLEGACGSCASSTVTMSLGIEKVLQENFGTDIKILQLEADDEPQELTLEAVQQELTRIGPAMKAMGAQLEIVRVDPQGEVQIRFQGSKKVQQGLELALLDIPHCQKVQFLD